MPFTGEIIENEKLGKDIHILKIKFPELKHFSHEPGQFAILAPNGIGRAYSIANFPGNRYLEFCIKKVPGGKVSPLLCSMKPGESVVLEAPFGDFILNKNTEHNLIFICIGTGIAPIKAMLEYVIKEGFHKDREVVLVYGCREKTYPYSEFLSELSNSGVNVIVTKNVEKTFMDFNTLENFEAYICGSPEFVKNMIEICKQRKAEKINYEKCIFSSLKILRKPLGLLP